MKPNLTTGILFSMVSGCVLAAGNDWMTPLNGALPISRFSIPGSHDSGARYEPVSGTAKCQNLTIGEQLNAGVRFLDIRCRHLNDAFTIHHGRVYQNIDFTDVLDATYGFLNSNPGETVIMSVKEEFDASGNTRSFEGSFDSYAARNAGKWLLASSIPTLGQARGKIVLFRRFQSTSPPKGIDATHWPDNASFSSGSLTIQDQYRIPDPEEKWKAVLPALEGARKGAPDTLYVNFTSAYVPRVFGVPDISAVSDHINPKLADAFKSRPNGRFGIVVMDFADARHAELIYRTNRP